MVTVNIHEAKTHLSRLIAEGKEVIIARYGVPVAKLVPLESVHEPRQPGSAKEFEVPDSFFEQLPDEILNGFER